MKDLAIKLVGAAATVTVLNLVFEIPTLAFNGSNLILNGSFENGNFIGPGLPNFTRLAPGSSNLTDWTIGGSGVDWHNSNQMQFPSDGQYVVDLNLDGVGNSGTLSQTFASNPGEFYTLSFYLAGPGSNLGFPDPRKVQVDIAGLQQIFSTPASPNTNILWQQHQLAFKAIGNQTTLTFSSLNGAGFWGPVLDDVSVKQVESVPEPTSTLSLLALGTLGAASTLKRKLKSSK